MTIHWLTLLALFLVAATIVVSFFVLELTIGLGLSAVAVAVLALTEHRS